ncbi:hypothetical protein J4Q44_G00276060 [Coregonus suidteri]|uniref:Uncharacterized protein n=1 Tax=Coregonus suidteri TaxID=861788 RepID=A0AAN8L177_9TELE
MASLCKRQQCTIERRGFRQDLDSWRHKLIHCVGFESILEGLFGSGLVEDLTLFKDCEPEGVSDWSFDENCLFCCLRRDKVKEHLVGLSNQGLESGAKPLLVKDQTKISRLEKQAEEFLNAVLYKKDVPSFSDPHIPVVALEIMQRMIRQFAAEYTSKTSSSSQDSHSAPRPAPHPDQSLPPPPSLPTVPPAASPGGTATASVPSQNPVLSKLLMADQDSPLDLTVKKPLPQPVEQDGVLDLSLKKGRARSSTSSLRSPHLSQTSTLRGECLELSTAKARDLQSTSTLEEFMTKLCLHHQRQIVDALGFLQTEVKAVSSSSTSLASASKPSCSVEHGALQGPSPAPCLETPGRAGQKLPLASTPKGSTEGRETVGSRLVAPEQTAVLHNLSGAAGPALDLRKPVPGESKALATLFRSTDDSVSKHISDHAPLKIKIMKSSSLADGKKLSCVLTTSLPAGAGTLEEQQGISDSSTRADIYSAGLGSSVKRHDHADRSTRQRGSFEHTKDTLVKQSPPEKTTNNIPPVSPGTARKTIKGSSYHRPRDTSSVCRFVTDPDLGHCDIVYIDKPITECFRERQHRLLPRRNARKSTRGHMYVEEMWELKTVRTLARTSARNDSGNCPAPMPELITLVTPKQVLGKPEGVPLVDMPFVGGFVETVSQKSPSEHPAEIEGAGDVEAAAASASEMALIVETSQTDPSQCKEQTAPPPPSQSPPVENEQSAGTDSEQPRQSVAPEDILDQTVVETADQDVNSVHNYIVLSENPEQVLMGKDVNSSHDKTSEEELVQDMLQSVPEGQNVVIETQQESASLTSSLESTEDKEVVSAGAIDKEQAEPLEPQSSVDQKLSAGSGGEAKAGMEVPAESEMIEVQETGKVEPDLAPGDAKTTPESTPTKTKRPNKASLKQTENPSENVSEIPQVSPETPLTPVPAGESVKSPLSKRLTKASLKQSEKPSENTPENSAVTQSSAELKVEKAQPAPKAKPSETQKTAEETRVQTRPKLRSSMMVAKEVEVDMVESQQVSSEGSALTEDSSRSSVSSASEKPGRMPLRSESNKTDVASQSITPATPPTPVENRKSALRVQRSPTPSTSAPITAEKWSEVASPIRLKSPVRLSSPIRFKPERIIKSPLRDSPLLVSSPLPSRSVTPLLLPKLELPVQTRNKFLELLDVEENQQKISSLNTKFEKMHRGWVQIDKEGHPTPRHKNKADRQAAIWKSKRRVRKPKSSDHQRYSLVQMLFKNDLDLASICRWYMESTETQSLVIVKKVNTRLPSETQLLFPGMSQRPSQGVFPSLQAERLKKHLKKFAMASPVKSNPKSQKLIAKALEQEVSTSTPKGKEKRELTTATRISTKAYVSSAEAQAQPADGQKASAKAKNPASARILRKYSNIREKMQGQQSSKKPKRAPRKELEASKVKPSKPPKTKLAKPIKLKPATAQRQKLSVSVDKSVKEPSVVKTERAQPSPSRKTPAKAAVQQRSVKSSSSSRTLRDLGRKESASPQRSPQRVMTPKAQKNTPAPATVPKNDFNKQQVGAEKAGVDKTIATKAGETKGQTKRPSQSRVSETKVTESKGAESNGAESAAETQQNMDVKTPGSPDQVLTRSQRKMEATPPPSVPQSASPKPATKKANEPAQSGTPKGATKRALEPTHTVSASPKPAIKRGNEPAQSGTPKGATKRSQESPQTPAKRTRTSLQK